LLGIEVPAQEAVRILSALHFQPKAKGDSITCRVPSWRSDICREVDLIEEVARVHGYNKIPTERKIRIEVEPVDARQKLVGAVGTYLNGCGFYETINVTFVEDSVAGLLADGGAERDLAVGDESRKSANLLRRTLIGSLLGVLKTNANAKNLPCRIFEIADTFVPAEGPTIGLPTEKAKLALACDGDFRDLRGVIEGLIRSIEADAQIALSPADLTWAQTGAEILLNSQTIGVAGLVSEKVRQRFDFKELSPCAAELEFDALLGLGRGQVKVKPIPRFPAIQRDLSVIVDEDTRWSDIIEAVADKAPGELQNVNFVGVYRGKGIPAGHKSVTLSLQFRDEDGTLRHETVDGFQADIVQGLAESVGAVLRDS
jgi:phenylalanyl-tRNA synthetase beta chain